jgi:hypothetical protein
MTHEEHSRVRLTRNVGNFGEYAAGKVGTVVHVFPEGRAYLVEFTYDGPAGQGAYGEVVQVTSDALEAA